MAPDAGQMVVSFLAPFLPHLVAGGTEAIKGLGKKLGELGGEATWKQAQAVWTKIKTHFGKDAEVKSASDLVAANPTDANYTATLQKALSKKLEANPDFARELLEMLGGAQNVQEVIAKRGSVVARVAQKGPSHKRVKATDDSIIIDVTQKS
ncbi:MAG: hypothetical protein NUW24_10600 [Anaerolineae bacterium]|jgi:hypothetical protein|nr:hypothetical protein [Anaerolineae bacterium]MDH7472865.1 hypothetical protein [Anaerolineae bacterium]